jgi:hypothetical protein
LQQRPLPVLFTGNGFMDQGSRREISQFPISNFQLRIWSNLDCRSFAPHSDFRKSNSKLEIRNARHMPSRDSFFGFQHRAHWRCSSPAMDSWIREGRRA